MARWDPWRGECWDMIRERKDCQFLFLTKRIERFMACAREENCAALLEGIFREGQMHFLVGGDSGMLVWQRMADGAEIVAIHSLPESWGTGLGHSMLEEAMKQIGEGTIFLWAFRENKRARRFYEKHGFHWDGTERISEFDGAAEVRYVRA